MSYASEEGLERVGAEMEPTTVKRTVIEYAVLALIFFVVSAMAPTDLASFGAMSAIPSIFLLAFIFYTKRILEGLTLASLLAFFMAYKWEFFGHVNETLTGVLTDGDTQWLFIVWWRYGEHYCPDPKRWWCCGVW